MIKIEGIEVWGFQHAVRGMRNPMNSWDKSDSVFYPVILGKNDLDLMHRLYIAGAEHRKFMRQIVVSMDITAPLYWWKEFDTYKVGTVSNSCSTMHKIHAKEFTLDDFSHEHLLEDEGLFAIKQLIDYLNDYRARFNGDVALADGTVKKDWWWQMIQLLPSSYNQKRTITMNYENVATIINQRSGHKLDEWNTLVAELKKLPYITEIMGD